MNNKNKEKYTSDFQKKKNDRYAWSQNNIWV